MARYSHALLSFFLLACVLAQTSYCSRSSPIDDGRPRRDETRIGPVEKKVIADPADHHVNADGALPSPATTVSAAGGHDGAAGSERRSGALAQAWRHSVVPHLKLARRFLVGEGTDSAPRPSCHSNNGHITCSPPALH